MKKAEERESRRPEHTPLLPKTSVETTANERRRTSTYRSISLFTSYTFVFLGALTQSSSAFFFHIAQKFQSFPTSTAVYVSSFVNIIFPLVWMGFFDLWDEFRISGSQFRRLALRGFLSASSLYLANISLTRIPVGNFLTILALSPAIASVLAAIFLGDPITWKDTLILIVNLFGVTLVAQPSISLGGDEAVGTFVALFAALFSSFNFIIIKKMGTSVHYILLGLSGGINSLALSLVFMDKSDVSQIWKNLPAFYVVLIGSLCGAFTQILLNKGMQVVRPGLGLAVRTFNVPVTVALGALFLNENITWPLFFGAFLVTGSIFTIGILQYLDDNGRRERHHS